MIRTPVALSILAALAMPGCSLQVKPPADPFYSAVLAGDPNNPAALYTQGQAMILQGQMKEARAYFRKMTASTPQYAAGWRGLGESELELGNFKAAEAAFLRGLEIEPQAGLQLGLVNAVMFQGRQDEAGLMLTQLEPALQGQAAFHRVRGDFYLLRQQFADAAGAYRRSLELDPSQMDLKRRLIELAPFLPKP